MYRISMMRWYSYYQGYVARDSAALIAVSLLLTLAPPINESSVHSFISVALHDERCTGQLREEASRPTSTSFFSPLD